MQIDNLLQKYVSLENKLTELDIQLEAKNTELFELARVGAMITSILELDGILSSMLEISLRLLRAEVGCILVWNDDDSKPITKISWGVDYSFLKQIKYQNNMDIAMWIKTTGEMVVINEFPANSKLPFEVNSVLAAPFNCRQKTIGVLFAINKIDSSGFQENDKKILETLVSFASVAIQNSKLLEESVIRQKLEDELSLANEVQNALLPANDFEIPGVEISNIYYPAGKVGGDYYDIIPITDNKFIVLVGDVSNKGVPAALMMTAVRSVVRHEIRSNSDIAEIMENINITLCRDVLKQDNMFISLIMVKIDLKKMEITSCNAGHLPPLFFNPCAEKIIQLRKGGIILGQFEDCKYQSETIKIKSGDRLLCFTDGATECVDSFGNMYGREGLISFTQKYKDLKDMKFMELLKSELDSFTTGSGSSQFDDITCVKVRIK